MVSSTADLLNENQCDEFKIKDSELAVINSLIINCGYTPYNKPIRTYAFDSSSRAKHGAKWKYYTKSNTIANDLIKAEEAATSSFEGKKFPPSYPYVTLWGTSTANDEEFNSAIRDKATEKGKLEGKKYLQNTNEARITITATLKFNGLYSIGSVLSCTFPSHNLNGFPLRITDIQYTDYTTTLTLLEDASI